MRQIFKSEKVPEKMQNRFNAITALTDKFCRENLSKEFAQLARKATAVLCRKQNSPLIKGDPQTWACGIIYAIGSVNFIFDKSQEYYTSAADLCSAFNVSKSTASAKSRIIHDLLKIGPMDPNWFLPSKMDENPIAWFISVDGFFVDARQAPPEIQEIAYAKGIIPYLPYAKNKEEDRE